MLVCWDSSALVKLLVDEPGSHEAARLWDEADVVLASRLVVPEVRAAIEAATRAHRLARPERRRALSLWDRYASGLRMLELTPAVAAAAADLTARQVLGGADAVHLASALAVAEAGPVLAVWDGRLRAASRREGVRLAPAVV